MSCAALARTGALPPVPKRLTLLPLPSACIPRTCAPAAASRPSLAHSATSRAHLDSRRQHLTHKGDQVSNGIRIVATASTHRAQRARGLLATVPVSSRASRLMDCGRDSRPRRSSTLKPLRPRTVRRISSLLWGNAMLRIVSTLPHGGQARDQRWMSRTYRGG